MTPRAPKTAEPLKFTVACGQFDVIVEEMRPGYVILRRWNAGTGNWQRKAIGRVALRDERGRAIVGVEAELRDKAWHWYAQITGQSPADAKKLATRPFAIRDAWKVISDPETGKYPHASPFRREIRNALDYAGAVWGDATAWTSIGEDQWNQIIRRRIGELVKAKHTGIRATEILVSRLLTVVRWLVKTKRIPPGTATAPDDWRADLTRYWMGLTNTKREPEPKRPRYTKEEALKLFPAAWIADPRFGLLFALGAELRLGQVVRCRRSDLTQADGLWTLRVPGAGKKGGTKVDLTAGQVLSLERAFTGYLRDYEAAYQADGTDYHLFPGGYMVDRKAGADQCTGPSTDPTRHLSREVLFDKMRLTEAKAEVEHIDGRGAYGARRVWLDEVLSENISERGLKAHGGWSSTKVPHEVYAEADNARGRAEAAVVRAKVRGEQP